MNSKKIWLFLLLFAMSFSVVHDYTFALLEDSSCAGSCMAKTSYETSNESVDPLCKIHGEYHALYLFCEKSASIFKIEKRGDCFTYQDLPLLQKSSHFLKPPIA